MWQSWKKKAIQLRKSDKAIPHNKITLGLHLYGFFKAEILVKELLLRDAY